MKAFHGIIRSQDTEVIALIKEIGDELGMKMTNTPDLANFLLGLQENDYQVALFDCNYMKSECLKWVKVVRKIRPKVPLIIISDEIDQNTGGKVYEEGTFYLYILPVSKPLLRNVISAAIHIQQSN